MLGPLEMEPVGLFALCRPMAGCAEACRKASKRCPNLIGRMIVDGPPRKDFRHRTVRTQFEPGQNLIESHAVLSFCVGSALCMARFAWGHETRRRPGQKKRPGNRRSSLRV